MTDRQCGPANAGTLMGIMSSPAAAPESRLPVPRAVWADFHRAVPARQHGVAAVWQAVAAGIPRRTFADHTQRHGWHQLAHGIVAEPSSSNTYERQCWAALVSLRLRGYLTGASALWMYGAFGDGGQRPPVVDILLARPQDHPRHRPGVRIVRSRALPQTALDRRRGFVVVSALRAWTDLARHASVRELVVALAGLDRLRIATLDDVEEYVAQRGHFDGRWTARAALAHVGTELTHSGAEHGARRLIVDADLPLQPEPRPFAVRVDGEPIAEIDVAWPPVRYGIEVDGPHHLLPAQQQADRARDRRLSTCGWVIDRFTTEEIAADPGRFLREVRAGLAAAIARGADPWPP